jgi:hypothetical protein
VLDATIQGCKTRKWLIFGLSSASQGTEAAATDTIHGRLADGKERIVPYAEEKHPRFGPIQTKTRSIE